MNQKILCVDDDPNILEGFKRQLREKFHLDTALGGEEGLKLVSKKDPYAVVISDMRMPGMDGVRFLSRVKDINPDSVRVMLTGHADVDTAIDAVNEGHIFRFLTKPCSSETFAKTITAGVRQFQLVMAERELLEKTLSRSIKVLIDILSLVSPIAFSCAMRLRKYVRHISLKLQLPYSWQYELSALLSQIGCVTLPPETLEKVFAGQELTKEEREMFDRHPSIGSDLLARIPRMETIAGIIKNHLKSFNEFESCSELKKRDSAALGSQILKVALEFDKLVRHGKLYNQAIATLKEKPKEGDPLIIAALKEIEIDKTKETVKLLKVREIEEGMKINEDIRTKNGLLLVTKGHKVNYPLLLRLRNYWNQRMIDEKLRVSIPDSIIHDNLR